MRKPQLPFINFDLGQLQKKASNEIFLHTLFTHHQRAVNVKKTRLVEGIIQVSAKHVCGLTFLLSGSFNGDSDTVWFLAEIDTELCNCTMKTTVNFFKQSPQFDLAIVPTEQSRVRTDVLHVALRMLLVDIVNEAPIMIVGNIPRETIASVQIVFAVFRNLFKSDVQTTADHIRLWTSTFLDHISNINQILTEVLS